MAGRIILHIDMDAFFVSVEQRDRPSLRGKPAAVCGSSLRSVVTSASYEARAFGVEAGMSVQEARRRCPELILIKGDHSKYTQISARLFSMLLDYTPLVEVASIDEAYLDVTASSPLFKSTSGLGQAIKDRILREEGLTCSVGIGPNKLIAKLGSRLKKPDGLMIIEEEAVPEFLEELPVKRMHGIGPKLTEALNAIHIFTCGQLGRAPLDLLVKRFGAIGKRLQEMGRGIDRTPVLPFDEPGEAKSISHSLTLQKDTTENHLIRKVLLHLSERVSKRMREEGYVGGRVTLTVRYADFYTISRQKTLLRWVNSGPEIFHHGLELFESVPHAKPIRLLGVGVSLLRREWYQLELFDSKERRDRRENLLKMMDRLNDRFGEGTLTWALLYE